MGIATQKWFYANSYLKLMSTYNSMVPVEDQNEEFNKSLIVSDVWKYLAVLHKLEQGTFLLATLNMK